MATDAEVIGVRGVFLKLRTHAGLSARRLRDTEVDTRVLADLPVVQRVIRESGVPVEQAIVDAVTGCLATGQVEVTSVDTTNQRIAGRFAFNALDDADSLVHVTEGRFAGSYVQPSPSIR